MGFQESIRNVFGWVRQVATWSFFETSPKKIFFRLKNCFLKESIRNVFFGCEKVFLDGDLFGWVHQVGQHGEKCFFQTGTKIFFVWFFWKFIWNFFLGLKKFFWVVICLHLFECTKLVLFRLLAFEKYRRLKW